MENDKRLNYIYSKLVKSDNDLSGIVAYHYYKKQKIEWCKAFRDKNNRDASNSEIESFHSTFTEQAIDNLKSKANATVEVFASDIISKNVNNIKIQVEEAFKNNNKFWGNVWVNVVSSFVYSIFILIITLIVWSIKHDIFSELLALFLNEPK